MIEFQTLVTSKLEPRCIGKAIATASNKDQSDFFEGLSEGFKEFPEGDIGMLFIKDNISQRTKDFIKKLAEYICED